VDFHTGTEKQLRKSTSILLQLANYFKAVLILLNMVAVDVESMPKIIGFSRNRYYIYIDDLPLLGHIAFGVVDRGTNVIQIRPTTVCPYNCIFCSVDAGPFSRNRQSEFIIDGKLLVRWVRQVYDAKGGEVLEGLIDGVGEPPTHPQIVDIVRELKSFLPRVAMETRIGTLTKELIDRLEEAGLDRLNVSIDTLDEGKGRYLQGVEWYSVRRAMKLIEYTVKETSIDVHLTPVWIPRVNDVDIENIIAWGIEIGVGKRFPPFGIQKYEVHKYGRKVEGVERVGWRRFREFLERLEEKYGVPLYYRRIDFGMKRARRLPLKYSKREVIQAIIISPGWLKHEVIAVDREREVLITVVGMVWSPNMQGRVVKVTVIDNVDGIYIAKPHVM